MKTISIALLALVLVGSAFAQTRPTPFGFTPGMSREQTVAAVGQSHVKKSDDRHVTFDAAPGTGNGFDRFHILFSSKGLAKVMAVADVTTNRSGEQIKDKFATVKDALTAKYGKPENDFDFVHAGALWKENDEFTMSLLKEERTLLTGWTLSDGTTICLEAAATGAQDGQIELSYEFHPEFDAYKADRVKKEQSAY